MHVFKSAIDTVSVTRALKAREVQHSGECIHVLTNRH